MFLGLPFSFCKVRFVNLLAFVPGEAPSLGPHLATGRVVLWVAPVSQALAGPDVLGLVTGAEGTGHAWAVPVVCVPPWAPRGASMPGCARVAERGEGLPQ